MQTHQTTPIRDEHFTPFASLLLHFPAAVAKVVGANAIYYEYKPKKNTLEATIFYRREPGHNERIDIEFVRTAYSFGELESMVREEYTWANHFYYHRGATPVDGCSDCNEEFKV